MGKSRIKNLLIKLFGKICFIAKLGWRKIIGNKHNKKQKKSKRGNELTYHHIVERSMSYKDNRGETIENGALLSVDNHKWFNEQSASDKARMNKSFQEYKISILKKNNLLDEFGYFPTPSKKFLKRKENGKEEKDQSEPEPVQEELPNVELSNDKPLIVNSRDDYRRVFTQKGNDFGKRRFNEKNYDKKTNYHVNDLERWDRGCNTISKRKTKKSKKSKRAKKAYSFRENLQVGVDYNFEELKKYLNPEDTNKFEPTIAERVESKDFDDR